VEVFPDHGENVETGAAMSDDQPRYDHAFFAAQRTGSARSAAEIVPEVLRLVPATSVLDVGCGAGTWLAAFESLGVSDVVGIDRDVPSGALAVDESHLRRIDLDRPFDLGRTFDLVVCLEVAEHLGGDPAAFIASLTRHAEAVVFSAAVPRQQGEHHVNEQWPSYWAELFAAYDYEVFDLLRARFWGNAQVEFWYRQNLLIFATGEVARALRAEPVVPGPLDLIHPVLWELTYSHEPGIREAVKELPRIALGTAQRRFRAVQGRYRNGRL
jgi:SAM-dependent methyltransferase